MVSTWPSLRYTKKLRYFPPPPQINMWVKRKVEIDTFYIGQYFVVVSKSAVSKQLEKTTSGWLPHNYVKVNGVNVTQFTLGFKPL